MLIGVPRETKAHESRVGMTPASVREAVHHGHRVVVQHACGAAIGFRDDSYVKAGAEIAMTPDVIFGAADMITKDPVQARGLRESGAIAIAYETVTDSRGGLPLLAPMSEVAGRMSIHVGAHCLEMLQGGRGMLLGGVPGVPAADVVILGGGVVGTNAARMAMGMEARVTVIDQSLDRLYELDMQFGPTLNTIYSTVDSLEHHLLLADLVIGAVLVPGASAPKVITQHMVKSMKRGSVFVDVSIDQGGCSETSRPTTHDDPTYIVDGVVHYCVTNMPGAAARTATQALNNATLPFVLALADKGYEQALKEDAHLRNGLNVCRGRITYEAVARDLGETYTPALEALAA